MGDVVARALAKQASDKGAELTAQLTEKANKNQIFSMENMGQDIKTAMTGGSVAVVGVNSVLKENIVDRAVTEEKTTFINLSGNLFTNFEKLLVTDNVTTGVKYVLKQPTHADYDKFRAAVIPIEPNTKYKINIGSTALRFRVVVMNTAINFSTMLTDYSYVADRVIAYDSNINPKEIEFTNTNGLTLIIYVGNNSSEPSLHVRDSLFNIPYLGVSKGNLDKDLLKLTKKYPEDYGAKGDGVTDDTQAIKDLITYGGKKIELKSGSKYLTSSTIDIETSKTKVFDGNNALVIANGDFAAFKVKGTLADGMSANPKSLNEQILVTERSTVIKNVRITSKSGADGIGILIQKVFGLSIKNCDIFKMRDGLFFIFLNRNLIIDGNHIYALTGNGLYFETSIHQINIINNHISYCRNCIYSYNSDLCNVQIVGNDIEAGEYPAVVENIMLFEQNNSNSFYNFEIVGNSFEGHGYSKSGIKLVSSTFGKITQGVISGNLIGINETSDIYLKNALGLTITGNHHKQSSGYPLFLESRNDTISYDCNTIYQELNGKALYATDDSILNAFSFCHNNMRFKKSSQVFEMLGKLNGANISDNQFILDSANISLTGRVVNINVSEMKYTKIKDNFFDIQPTSTATLNIVATTIAKSSIRDNIVSGGNGAFFVLPVANNNLVVSGNI